MNTRLLKTPIKRAAGAFITTITLVILGSPAATAESWELRTAAQEVKGTRALEAGQVDKSITIMEANYGTTPYVEKGAMLTNLCLAHILKRDFETANRQCNRAVERGFNNREAHNNRGVLQAMQGNYQAAISDFEKAGCLYNCSKEHVATGNKRMAVAVRNLQRAQVQLAQEQQRQQDRQVVNTK